MGARSFKPLVDASLAVFDGEGAQLVFPISPFGATETRAERIARLERLGSIAPGCSYCERAYRHPTLSEFMPRHRASGMCESGRRNHCTCGACF